MSKANETSELKDLTKYRLDEINNIKEYFNTEIKERKDIIKKISNIVWHFKYCFICNGCWNTCRNSWSIFKFNIYRNDWCG